MGRWVRKWGDDFGEWHLLGEPPLWAVDRGVFVGACGQPLGDTGNRLQRVEEATVIGGRCAACDGVEPPKVIYL